MNTLIPINLLLLVATISFAQTEDLKIKTQIDSIVNAQMIANDIVGISIGIVRNNEIYYTKGYGTTEIHTNNPIDSLTAFHTASISKLFTATAIMQLSESGKIDITKKLIDYLPDFSMKDEQYKTITIEQMLTHTSGIGNYHWKQKGADSLAIKNYTLSLKKRKLSYAPGVELSHKTYSNTAYSVLGSVIETITHQQFDSYIRENILQPVGMEHSGYSPDRINEKQLAQPHVKNSLTKKVSKSDHYPNDPQGKPNGTLISCSNDLCEWMLHNLKIYNDSINNFTGVVTHDDLKKMWTTTHAIPNKLTSIGVGWWISNDDELGKYVFHVGNDHGFSATLMIFPEDNSGIVILCNGMYPMDVVWNQIPFDIQRIIKEKQ